MSDLTTDFLRQNEWATLQLIETCRSLTDEQLAATAVGTYGSIRDTLRHIVASEAGYASRLDPSIRRLPKDDPWPGFDTLAEMVSTNTEAFVAAAPGAGERLIHLDVDTEEPFDSDEAVILVQAFNHATDHRSQICTILTALGIEPPDLSGWEWSLAAGRMWRV
jgi:uncharacterized damage-inducible protein DinB